MAFGATTSSLKAARSSSGNEDNDGARHCTEARCGDGYVGPGEGCDDGNEDPTDDCNDCRPSCGDGIIQNDERCDDGNEDNTDTCRTMRPGIMR